MANGIVIRKHGHNMLEIVGLKGRSSHRRHLDEVWSRTDLELVETDNYKLEQPPQIELRKPLSDFVATNVERIHQSDKVNDGSDVRRRQSNQLMKV